MTDDWNKNGNQPASQPNKPVSQSVGQSNRSSNFKTKKYSKCPPCLQWRWMLRLRNEMKWKEKDGNCWRWEEGKRGSMIATVLHLCSCCLFVCLFTSEVIEDQRNCCCCCRCRNCLSEPFRPLFVRFWMRLGLRFFSCCWSLLLLLLYLLFTHPSLHWWSLL